MLGSKVKLDNIRYFMHNDIKDQQYLLPNISQHGRYIPPSNIQYSQLSPYLQDYHDTSRPKIGNRKQGKPDSCGSNFSGYFYICFHPG